MTRPKMGCSNALASDVAAAVAALVELGDSADVELGAAEVSEASVLVLDSLEVLELLEVVLIFFVFSAPAVTSTAMAVGRFSPLNVADVVTALAPVPVDVPLHTASVVPANLQSTICFLSPSSAWPL